MNKKNRKDSPNSKDSNEIARLLELEEATQTIDMGSLLIDTQLTSSGSFDLRAIHGTSLAQLLDALPIPALLIDRGQTIRFANAACGKPVEHRRKLEGEPLASIFTRFDDARKFGVLTETIFAQRTPQISGGTLDLGNGSIWARTHMRSVRVGIERLVLLIVEDLTHERKQLLLTQKHERQLLKARNELERLVRERTASLQEKEVLLKEIHHRVKNNLQIIASLVQLESFHANDKSAADIVEDLESRIRAIATVHEKLYESESLMRIDVNDYLQDLTQHLFHAYRPATGGIELTIDVKDIVCGVDTAIPMGLIVSELVSNSLKHGFPEGKTGSIAISLCYVDGNELELVVSDDGVGMPMDLEEIGSETLGLSLVKSLADQLHAEMRLNRAQGTRFSLRFKEVEKRKG